MELPVVPILSAVAGLLFSAVEVVFGRYVKLFSNFTKAAFGLEIRLGEQPRDERLRRLDDAQGALAEGLAALDELKRDAVRSQQEFERAATRLEATLASKISAESKLIEVRKLMSADIDAFRRMAGIDPQKERVVGFISGVVASLIAAGLIWFVPMAARLLLSLRT
ncbi:MAG: hypothetical protein V4707_01345 [Pseudomonadota bacterium]